MLRSVGRKIKEGATMGKGGEERELGNSENRSGGPWEKIKARRGKDSRLHSQLRTPGGETRERFIEKGAGGCTR